MRATLATLSLGLLCACGQGATTPNPAAYRELTGMPGREAFADATLLAFRAQLAVNASRVDLHFVVGDEQITDCHGDAACTTLEPNGWDVITYWPDVWHANHAYLLAHELCHVWYWQTGEHGDPGHTHTECFANPEGFYQSHPGEAGIAWSVAQAVAAEFVSE